MFCVRFLGAVTPPPVRVCLLLHPVVGPNVLAVEVLLEVVERWHAPPAVLLHPKRPALQLEPTRVAPESSPAVSCDPEGRPLVGFSPADDLDVVVDLVLVVVLSVDEDAVVGVRDRRVVVHQGVSRDERARDRPPGQDLLHDVGGARDAAVLRHLVPHEAGPGDGEATRRSIRGAVSAHVRRRARVVLRIVGLAGLIRDAGREHRLEDHPRVTTVAPGSDARCVLRAVDQGLTRQHHVREGRAPGDLHPVVKCRNRAVDPAGTAVLRDVLVDITCDVVDAVDVAPVPVPRHVAVRYVVPR
mmetsp:Transcript_15927/g.40630  ORF Transcript_15927/g.40630 Transcript_15927/m.40630 type:complete len:300 (-) Transcript_15927:146-1045(-)